MWSCIFRREYGQLESIIDRSKELFTTSGRLRLSPPTWYLYGGRKKIELRAMEQPQDARKFQGRPHDLKAYDEITHFTRWQYVFTKAWNRSVYKQQRCRVVAAGNPPTDADGRWVIDYWAPWLDEKYPNPAAPGELRYFISANNKDYEVEGKGKFSFKGQVYESKSRTFIPSTLSDNPFLEDTGYRATLDGLPEPLRSQLLYGDFRAGIEDDPWQLIPTDWIRAAQQRWKERRRPEAPIDQIGLDVSRGGVDRTVVTPRIGNYFCKQEIFNGVDTDSGPKVAGLVVSVCKDQKPVIGVDAIGVGASPLDHLKLLNYKVYALIGSEGSNERSKNGLLGFVNLRAQWGWRLREALDPETGDDLAIPDDPEILSDLTAMKWKLALRGIQIEEKEKIKERLGRSPDKGESLIYSMATPNIAHQGLLEWMEEEYNTQQNEVRRRDTSHGSDIHLKR
jgi:hypothetical protein